MTRQNAVSGIVSVPVLRSETQVSEVGLDSSMNGANPGHFQI